MKWWIFRRIVLSIFLLVILLSETKAQDDLTVKAVDHRYQKRVEKYHSFWDNLIPEYTKVQYAGSMGLISLGTGWDYGRNKQWETDIIVGYVPKFSVQKNQLAFTLKQNFMPWRLNLGEEHKGFKVEPLACGAYLNTTFGHNYWTKEPDRNSNGYYTFATKLRLNIYIGQRIIYNIKPRKRSYAKSITFFYEISSNDIYISQAVKNSYLKPKDYLHLSFGLKVQHL